MTSEGSSANPVGAAPPLLKERYEIGERLADGTFFLTHRGRDIQTGRVVAIKVLKSEYARDEAFSDRLIAEAHTASQLRHPNIAQVFDAWREQGTVVVVSEWVPGINLKDRIRRVAPFPLAVAMDIFLACAQALSYAEQAGFTHGDIRPDNIIITSDGRVKLTDFGVGASVASSSHIQLSALPRAAAYLAPELAEGRPADARTDLYALGCILFEMLAGEVPFEGDTPLAIAVKHLHEPPPSLKKANPAVPNAVDGIGLKCMQKDPAARYQSMAAVLDDIRRVRDAIRSDQSLSWSPMQSEGESASVPEKTKARSQRRVKPQERLAGERRRDEYVDTGPSARLLLAVALLGVLMIVLFFGAIQLMTRAPAQVTVPLDLVNAQEATAVAELQKLGLKAEVQRDYNDRVASGIVVNSVPAGGTEIRAEKTVRLLVSQGPQPVKVPDVTGKGLLEARRLIQSSNLVVGNTKEEFSEVVTKGQVISQTPVGQTETGKRSAVSLIVSKGPEPLPQSNSVEMDPNQPENPSADAGETPSAPDASGTASTAPAPPATPEAVPNPELQARDHVVTVRVPKRGSGPQRVRIMVHNEDGTEQSAYDEEHQPGEKVEQTVTTFGAKGKCEIRVYINDELKSTTKV